MTSQIVLLGTSGYHPTDLRHTPCFLLPESGCLFDAGTGMYRLAEYLQTDYLDLFLSHAHLDHIVGLTYFIDILYRHPLERIRIFGESAKLDAIREHLFSDLIFPSLPPVQWVDIDDQPEIDLAPRGVMRWCRLRHKDGSVGYRYELPCGKSIAYVTDTTASDDAGYLDLIRDVDLLLHECYFPDEYAELAVSKGHSSASAVARLARAARVGRLVLVHFNPLAPQDRPVDLGQVRAIFPETIFGEDRLVVEF